MALYHFDVTIPAIPKRVIKYIKTKYGSLKLRRISIEDVKG